MKEAIGGTFLFNIVILFILLFTGIMTVTINRSKAFAVKDDIVGVIEKNNGEISSLDGIHDEIVEAMTNDSYRAVGTCPDGYTGYNREGVLSGGISNASEGSSICIQMIESGDVIEEGSQGSYNKITPSVDYYKESGKLVQVNLSYEINSVESKRKIFLSSFYMEKNGNKTYDYIRVNYDIVDITLSAKEMIIYYKDGTKIVGEVKSIDEIDSPPNNIYNISDGSETDITVEKTRSCYYKIMVFYNLDIPVLKSIFNFNLIGETKVVTGCDFS